MKVTLDDVAETFKPFDITLRVETAEEASQLYARFNHAEVNAVYSAIPHGDIRRAIETAIGGRPGDYWSYHQALCDLIRGKSR